MEERVEVRVAAPWALSWSGASVGALAGLVALVLFGFMGTALGAHAAGAEGRLTDMSGVGLLGLAWAVFASFLAFVIAGWVAANVAGSVSAESGALHGAVAFLLGVSILLFLAAVGAGYLSGWYAGLAPAPAAAPVEPRVPVDPEAARAARNAALGAATALLIGLMGSVIGGWMGSGERMDWTTARRRVLRRTT